MFAEYLKDILGKSVLREWLFAIYCVRECYIAAASFLMKMQYVCGNLKRINFSCFELELLPFTLIYLIFV